MTDKFTRSQILKASGAFIAGAAAAKGLPLVVGNEPAQAQTIGTFAEVRVASSNNPQVTIVQINNNDFARLRFSTFGKSAWDIATGGSNNVMNFFNPAVRGNVMTLTTTGNLSITGVFAQGSSRELKENITELSSKEALETLADLSPVKFKYKADTEKVQHIGFIAEDVPELVATPDRKRLSSMDIVGVLTKVVQEQQQTILALAQKVKALEEH
ncbi:tail fiber domain-containing protein [Nostoc sp. XA013]|nr:tail fiber domain-containing protein [Nostoc sp. XA013]